MSEERPRGDKCGATLRTREGSPADKVEGRSATAVPRHAVSLPSKPSRGTEHLSLAFRGQASPDRSGSGSSIASFLQLERFCGHGTGPDEDWVAGQLNYTRRSPTFAVDLSLSCILNELVDRSCAGCSKHLKGLERR